MAAGEQDLLGLRNQRGQRRLRGRRGVGLAVAEDLFDIGVPGQHVVADRRGEEYGRLARGQDRERVREEPGGKRVERRVDRAARPEGGDGGHRGPPGFFWGVSHMTLLLRGWAGWSSRRQGGGRLRKREQGPGFATLGQVLGAV